LWNGKHVLTGGAGGDKTRAWREKQRATIQSSGAAIAAAAPAAYRRKTRRKASKPERRRVTLGVSTLLGINRRGGGSPSSSPACRDVLIANVRWQSDRSLWRHGGIDIDASAPCLLHLGNGGGMLGAMVFRHC